MFVVKTFAASLLILMVMQIKWGEQTIDDTIYSYMTSSTILQPVGEAATGGVLFIRNMLSGVGGTLQETGKGTAQEDVQPERRSLFNFKRHNEVEKEDTKPKKSRFTSWVSEED